MTTIPPASDEALHPRSSDSGRYVASTQSPPEDVVRLLDKATGLTQGGRDLLAAWRSYKVGSTLEATKFRGRDDAVEVVDEDDAVWVVTTRDAAAIMILEDLEDDDRAGYVSDSTLAKVTGVDADVFRLIKRHEPDEAGRLIGSILQVTDSVWKTADELSSNNDEQLGMWFATYDNETVTLDTERIAFQRM